jgi:1-acyl-sn-glycerol-3-phosphate acyltransferase
MHEMMFLRNRLHRICRFLLDILFGLHVSGEKAIPRKGSIIIVSNHISELDPPVLGSSIPRQTHYMAKHQLFTSRMSEFYLPRIGAFPVNRDRIDTAALRTALEILREGSILVIFPEGTRSTDGQLLPVKPGIGLLAARSAAPVLPVFLWGTDHPVGALFRKTRFSVTCGKMISPDKIADLHEKGGARLVAESIMASIERIGKCSGHLA